MDRRLLIASGLASLAAPLAHSQEVRPPYAGGYAPTPPPAPLPDSGYAPPPPPPGSYANGTASPPAPAYATDGRAQTYTDDELVGRVSDFLGVTAESAGAVIERTFKDNGRPTGYIAGEEGSGAFVLGLRYGRGLLYMKNRPAQTVYWQGPSVGFDAGGNFSRVFTLVYNLQFPDAVFQRFPGVEGSAYFIGGLGVNYQRGNDITLAPMRAGVGFRLGANVGYLAYTRQRNILPF